MPLSRPSSSTTTTTTASNAGAGAGVYASVTGANLYFKTLVAGTNVTITSSATEITIGGPAGSGEANTASNLTTTGGQIFSSKVGVDLQFRTINAVNSNVEVSTSTSTVDVKLSATPSITTMTFTNTTTMANPAAGVTGIFSDGTYFRYAYSGGSQPEVFHGSVSVLTGSTISTSISQANTGLASLSLPVGYYQWQVNGSFQSNTTTCGFGCRLANGTGTINEIQGQWNIRQAADGVSSNFQVAQLATTTDVASASVVAANTKYPFSGTGWFYLSVAGTVVLQFRSEVASPSQVTLSTGTSLAIQMVT